MGQFLKSVFALLLLGEVVEQGSKLPYYLKEPKKISKWKHIYKQFLRSWITKEGQWSPWDGKHLAVLWILVFPQSHVLSAHLQYEPLGGDLLMRSALWKGRQKETHSPFIVSFFTAETPSLTQLKAHNVPVAHGFSPRSAGPRAHPWWQKSLWNKTA